MYVYLVACGSLRGAAAVLCLMQYDNSFSDKLHQQVITAAQWGLLLFLLLCRDVDTPDGSWFICVRVGCGIILQALKRGGVDYGRLGCSAVR